MDQIKIIKHDNPIPVNDSGHILHPFDGWENSLTGAKWFTKFNESYLQKDFIPLSFIDHNPWLALSSMKILAWDLEEAVKYKCPYTNYFHYWCLPLYLFTENIKEWGEKTNKQQILDKDLMKKYYYPYSEKGLRFNKIQRTLLGSGYTLKTPCSSGDGYLYDTLIRVDNGDIIAGKVWIWFNKR